MWLREARASSSAKKENNKTLRSVHFGVMVVKLINAEE